MISSQSDQSCKNCGTLLQQLNDCKQKNKDLEDVNERLTTELQNLLILPASLTNIDLEIELKKSIYSQMTSSQESEEPISTQQGVNLKKIQQDLRVSKKAEQLAKEKLAQTKRSLEKTEKDFSKYREDSEARADTMKTEISILQKHYDQLQNNSSVCDNDSNDRHFSNHSGGGQDLLKIIEDYSKQNELKSKEIEAVTFKLDKKQGKLSDIKKRHSEAEVKVSRLRGTLDNVKTFLKLLNTNFIKSMKSQNIQLKEQIAQSERDMNKDMESFKSVLSIQINKILADKDKEMTVKVQSDSFKMKELTHQVQSLKSEHEQALQIMKQDNEYQLSQQQTTLQAKVASLKQKVQNLSDQLASRSLSTDSLKDQLTSQFQTKEKQANLLELQLQSERDRHSLIVNELHKELAAKSQVSEECKAKEQSLQQKLDSQESRHRVEVEKLLEKLDKVAAGGYDKELTQQILQQRDSQMKAETETQERLLREMKEMYEVKIRERDTEMKEQEKRLMSKIGKVQIKCKDAITERDSSKVEKDQEIKQMQNQVKIKEDEFNANMLKNTMQREVLSKQVDLLQRQLQDTQSQLSAANQSLDTINERKLQREDQSMQTEALVVIALQQEQHYDNKIMKTQISNISSQQEEIAPPMLEQQIVDSNLDEQANNQNNSRASSSRDSSSVEQQFEGGQDEKKEDHPEEVQAPSRPPLIQARPPMPFNPAARGRGMPPQFRAPGIPGFRPSNQPRPMIFSPPVVQENLPAPEIIQVASSEVKEQAPASFKAWTPKVGVDNTQKEITEIVKVDEVPLQKSEPIKQMEETKQVQKTEEESKEPKLPGTLLGQPAPTTSILDFRNNRFFGMINGFLTFLTRRKKGYTGRAASAMYYDKAKGRYIIDGEDDSDDDVPPPPPPMKKKVEIVDESVKSQEEKQPPKEENAAEALARPGFAGALANRGRGRGRGPNVTFNRFPQTFGANQLSATSFVPSATQLEDANQPVTDELKGQTDEQSSKQQEENSILYTTSLDITLNQTQYFLNDEQPDDNNQSNLNQTMLITSPPPVPTEDPVRESQWLIKFKQQQDKINNYKYKVSMLQQELSGERDQNEQTIENFTVLCQDLKFKGMDEVEDLQSDISILKGHLKTLAHNRAYHEVKISQLTDTLKYTEEENQEMRQQIRELKCKIIQDQINQEMLACNQVTSLEVEGNNQVEQQYESAIFDLQIQLDNQKWRSTVLEAEKLAKVLDSRDLQLQVDSSKGQIHSLKSEIQRLQAEMSRIEQEQHHFGQEQFIKLEKEKETIREIMHRIQTEKERLHESNRERVAEYEGRLKKLENDKHKSDLDQARVLREKDGALDLIKNQNMSVNQALRQGSDETKQLHSQVRELQAKMASLNAKRQTESDQAEQVLKAQLRQVQDMLQQRAAQAEQMESKNEEMNQELQQMDAIKHKLTENIVYLQNEIRKRDDLIENSSEFGGDFEMIGGEEEDDDSGGACDEMSGSLRGENYFNRDMAENNGGDSSMKHSFQIVKKTSIKRKTFNQALQTHLEETRQQLKFQIEERLLTERSLQNVEHAFRKLVGGLTDISKILDSQSEQSAPFMDGEQSSLTAAQQQDDNDITQEVLDSFDETVHSIIGKVFGLQRGYESELSEVRHKVKMQQMQIEEGDNLRFDIEILSDEKAMLEGDLAQICSKLKESEAKTVDIQRQLSEAKHQEGNSVATLKDGYERQIMSERLEGESKLAQQRADTKRQIDEIHETFKSQMLPAVKQKYQARYQQLQDKITEIQTTLTSQLDEEKRRNIELEQKQHLMLNQSQIQLDQQNDDSDRLREQLKYVEIQNQELQNTILSIKSQFEDHSKRHSNESSSLRSELEDLKDSHSKEIQKLVSDFDDIAQRLKSKGDSKKKKLKETQTKFKQVIAMFEEEIRKVNLEKQELTFKYSGLLAEIESRPQQVDTKVMESRISQLEQEIVRSSEDHQEQIDNLAGVHDQQSRDAQAREESLQQRINEIQTQNNVPPVINNQLLIQEWSDKLVQMEQAKDKERESMIENYTQREEQFKTSAKDVIQEMKEKLKKSKVTVTKASEDLAQSTADRKVLELKIIELKSQYRQHLETHEAGQSEQSQAIEARVKEVESQLEAKDKQIATLEKDIEILTHNNNTMISQFSELLQQVGAIHDLNLDWDALIDRLRQLLTNYEEDQRSMRTMIDEKERLSQLSDQYYLENQSIVLEKSKLQERLECAPSAKLEKKVQILEEESREMKSDFLIKIDSFVQEIDTLKSKLSQYEAVEEEEEEEEKLESFQQDTTQNEKEPTFMDQSKTSHIQKNDQSTALQQQQRSGIFNSIASFFLTDSQLDVTEQ